MSSPSKRTWPLVGLYTPVSMLKNVVLPAPFGPIKLIVEARGIVKSTSSTASKPPNSFRSRAVTRMLSLTSGLLVLNGRVVHAGLEFELPPLLGEESLRSQQHHEHDDRSVDPVRHERRVEAAAADHGRRILLAGIAHEDVVVHPAVEVGDALEVEVLEDRSAGDDAPDVAHPAEDDHRHDEDRDVEEEIVREDARLDRREPGAGDATE